MNRRLQFGSGPNLLPPPWENFDAETDISKPLPFPIGSARFILAEHVIEHVEFRAGLRFLQECFRVLETGGVLRLAFPDITRHIDVEDYRPQFRKYYSRVMASPEDVWLSICQDWEHQSCWTGAMAKRVLLSVGFESALEKPTRYSDYAELEEVSDLVLRSETTVIEAVR